jgi:tumor protein p53-inducible protein 3
MGEQEVTVDVAYSSVNRADALQRRGFYPPPKGVTDILGLDAVGTVRGTNQRVMTIVPGGGNAEVVATHAGLLLPIPDGMTFRTAAAIPEVWITAYMLLRQIGNV